MTPVIETVALRKEYPGVVALQGVDLEIEAGGVVGLLGPNGAGKTTLVEILEGLRQPTAGHARVLGLDPTRQARALKERIGVQLQSTGLPDSLSAAEILAVFASFYGRHRDVEEVLGEVGLADRAGAVATDLSGGQRQRLALAMALVHDPELVVLDEPTSGLDPAARRGLHDIIRELRSRGRTILLTTHYIEEAEALCDRVIVLRAGEVVADGTPFELLGRARGTSTLWLAVDGGELDPAPLVAAGLEPQGREGDHYRFTATDPTAAIVALGEVLNAQSLRLTDLRLRRPTLEDVYLELVGPEAAHGASPEREGMEA